MLQNRAPKANVSALGGGVPVNFDDGTVHSIRSISQRGLAAAWARLAKQGLPSFERFDPGPRVHDPKQLVAWKVEATGGQFVFRVLYRGSLVDEAFSDSWAGKTLTEVTPASLRPAIIGASDQCASTGCPIYTVLRTYDGAGHAIDLERLLLPFGKNGGVQMMVGSLQLTSMQGTVERPEVVKHFEARSETILSLRISAASFNEALSKRIGTGSKKPIVFTAAQSEVSALNRAGNLKDATVNRFAVRQQYDLVIAALSFMSELKIDTVEPLVRGNRLDELIVVCKASRLSWPTTTMIIRNRPGCRPATDRELQQGLAIFESLSLSVAQQTLRFWE
jgi:uncharacterized protein DUF2336